MNMVFTKLNLIIHNFHKLGHRHIKERPLRKHSKGSVIFFRVSTLLKIQKRNHNRLLK